MAIENSKPCPKCPGTLIRTNQPIDIEEPEGSGNMETVVTYVWHCNKCGELFDEEGQSMGKP